MGNAPHRGGGGGLVECGMPGAGAPGGCEGEKSAVGVKISYDELGALYTDLLAIRSEFDEASARRSDLQDSIDRPYGFGALRDAAGAFESQWDDRRNKLNQGLEAVTERAKTVLEGFGDFDLQVAEELAVKMQGTD